MERPERGSPTPPKIRDLDDPLVPGKLYRLTRGTDLFLKDNLGHGRWANLVLDTGTILLYVGSYYNQFIVRQDQFLSPEGQLISINSTLRKNVMASSLLVEANSD